MATLTRTLSPASPLCIVGHDAWQLIRVKMAHLFGFASVSRPHPLKTSAQALDLRPVIAPASRTTKGALRDWILHAPTMMQLFLLVELAPLDVRRYEQTRPLYR